MQEMQVRSLGEEDPLEKKMTTHSSILAWEVPWTEETGGLHPCGLKRVRHDLVQVHTCAHAHTYTHTQVSSSS